MPRASLVVVTPLTLVVGFFAFSWPSLDTLFPANRARVPSAGP